ncbi:MAG TPA: hypothetical protein VH307_05125, partial [Streptosporangiaceae bacterium]|nr:hypothetical protein [Streptosporangiaceae bacterium]
YLDRVPYGHDEYRREVIAKQIELMHERDIWVPPDKADSASRGGTPPLQPAPRSRLRERSVRADST